MDRILLIDDNPDIREQRVLANAAMQTRQIRKYCPLDTPARELLKSAISPLGLSARA